MDGMSITVDEFDLVDKHVVIVRYSELDDTTPDGFPFGYCLYDRDEDGRWNDLPYEGNIGWDTADGARQAAIDCIEWIATYVAEQEANDGRN